MMQCYSMQPPRLGTNTREYNYRTPTPLEFCILAIIPLKLASIPPHLLQRWDWNRNAQTLECCHSHLSQLWSSGRWMTFHRPLLPGSWTCGLPESLDRDHLLVKYVSICIQVCVCACKCVQNQVHVCHIVHLSAGSVFFNATMIIQIAACVATFCPQLPS